MSAAWLPWAPVAALLVAWAAFNLHAWRKRVLKRRRTPAQIESALEAQVAIGSLAGIAPSDIRAHVLLVLEEDGEVTITGTGCDSLRMLLAATASAAFATAAYKQHDHDDDGSPS